MSEAKAYTPQHSDEEYLARNWFDGDESDVRLQRTKMVKTRKPQRCALGPLVREEDGDHQIPPGSRAWVESGIIDGDWQRNYACCQCMDQHIRDEEEDE